MTDETPAQLYDVILQFIAVQYSTHCTARVVLGAVVE